MSEKYKKYLLKIASSFDAITESCGEITNLTISLIEEKNDKAIIVLMNKISSVLDEKKESSNSNKIAKELYEMFNAQLESYGLIVKDGVFGADMEVSLINDGPFTIVVTEKDL